MEGWNLFLIILPIPNLLYREKWVKWDENGTNLERDDPLETLFMLIAFTFILLTWHFKTAIEGTKTSWSDLGDNYNVMAF